MRTEPSKPQPSKPQQPDLGGFAAGLTGDTAAPGPSGGGGSFIGVPDGWAYLRPDVPGQKPTGTPGSPASFRQAEGYGFAPAAPQYPKGIERYELSSMSPEDLWNVQRALSRVGLITKGQRIRPGDQADPVTISAFRNLLGYANGYGVAWQDALVQLANNPQVTGEALVGGSASARQPSAGRAGLTGKRKQTNRSAQLSDPESARALTDQLLQKHLGRKPTPSEYAKFIAALNGAERANPVVSTTTSTYQSGDVTASDTTTTGGLDAAGKQQVLEGAINSDPKLKAEKDKFTTDTDYFHAAMAALGSPS